MSRLFLISVVASCSLACGCVTADGPQLREVAQRPDVYLGRTVRVCGYVRNAHEDHGIWRSSHAYARRQRAMLGLMPAKATPHATSTCLTGEIVRTGCGAETICLDTADVPFALRETRTS